MLLACGAAGADPAKTDGTVTAWIGEDNNYYMILADGQPRRLTAPMEDILSIDDTDVTALTQDGQLITVKKDGSSFSQLSLNATEEEIDARRDRTFQLTEGKLTVGETVFSERAAVAATDGLVLYWVVMNLCQILQQWWIYREGGPAEQAKAAVRSKEEG
jgi:hypothetical protein